MIGFIIFYIVSTLLALGELRYQFILRVKDGETVDEQIDNESSYWFLIERFIPIWNIISIVMIFQHIINYFQIKQRIKNKLSKISPISKKFCKKILMLK